MTSQSNNIDWHSLFGSSDDGEGASPAATSGRRRLEWPFSVKTSLKILRKVKVNKPYEEEEEPLLSVAWNSVLIDIHKEGKLLHVNGFKLRHYLEKVMGNITEKGSGYDIIHGKYDVWVAEVPNEEIETDEELREFDSLLTHILVDWDLLNFQREVSQHHETATFPEGAYRQKDLSKYRNLSLQDIWEQVLVRFARNKKPSWIRNLEKKGIKTLGELMEHDLENEDIEDEFESRFQASVVATLWDQDLEKGMELQIREVEYEDAQAAFSEQLWKRKIELQHLDELESSSDEDYGSRGGSPDLPKLNKGKRKRVDSDEDTGRYKRRKTEWNEDIRTDEEAFYIEFHSIDDRIAALEEGIDALKKEVEEQRSEAK